MQSKHVPALGVRYWTAVSMASVAGANLGDFLSHTLHMGHVRGLAPLALVLAGILLAERRARSGGEAYYWLAIVTLRTAATNLADFATHDLRLGYGWVIAGLAAALAAMLEFRRGAQGRALTQAGLPQTDGRYWTAMLIAGTLGTAAGDFVSDGLGFGAGPASLITLVVLAAVFTARARPEFAAGAFYWVAIVAVRTAGTTVGDWLADGLTLAASTAGSLILLAGTLLVWGTARKQPVSA